MRITIAAFVALALAAAHNAHADGSDFPQTTATALAAGSPEAVVKALEKEIYRGNIVAAMRLGLMYRDGQGTPRDYAKARKLLKTAAERHDVRLWHKRGLADAQYALAVMHRDGLGARADLSAAESWFEQAAEQGHVQAQLAIAQMYFGGTGGKRDLERAFIWASIAAGTLTEAAQKDAERIREGAQKQLDPKQLARSRGLVKAWQAKKG